MVLWTFLFTFLLCTIFCLETSDHIINLYTLDKDAYMLSNEFIFETNGDLYNENFPLPFIHFATHTNFTEYSVHLVQGRWDDYIKPYFPYGLDEAIIRSSFKSALGFNTFDGGLTFIGELPMDINKTINFIGGFICSGIDRLLRNLVELKAPLKNSADGKVYYSADPMNYLCFDNLLKFLDLICLTQKEELFKMIDKRIFGLSPYTQFDIYHSKTDTSTRLKVRISFIIPEQNLTSIMIVPLIPFKSSLLRVYHTDSIQFKPLSISKATKLKTIVEPKLEPVIADLEPLLIRRHLTGIDHELYIQYFLTIQNQENYNVKIKVQEFIPYFLKPYFHTLKIVYGDDINKAQTFVPLEVIFNEKSDCYLNFGEFTLSAKQELRIVMNLEKTLLPFEQYPHDSSRGFDLPQMIFYYKEDTNGTWKITYVPSIVLMLPQPDFSMPFNAHAISAVLVGIMYKLYVTIMDNLP